MVSLKSEFGTELDLAFLLERNLELVLGLGAESEAGEVEVEVLRAEVTARSKGMAISSSGLRVSSRSLTPVMLAVVVDPVVEV